MNAIRIQTEDFDPGAEIAVLGNDGTSTVGAVASFVGIVRGEGQLRAVTLEHYPGFAEREIAAHIADAESRWPLLAVRVVHRTGRLMPGERIVFVGVAAGHRHAAFAAAEFLMDYLKTRAPFWKLEEREAGSAWVEAKAEDDTSAERWH